MLKCRFLLVELAQLQWSGFSCGKTWWFGMVANTISDSTQHFLKRFFRLSCCQFCVSYICHIFLLLLYCCLCVINLLSCHSNFSIPIILNPSLFLFAAQKVPFLSFLHCKLHVGSQAADCPKGCDSLNFQAAVAFIYIIMSSRRQLCWLAVFACRKWRHVLFQSVDRCILYCLCCWAGCWMLQDMDNMEASYIIYLKDGTFDQHEQSNIRVLTNTKWGIVMLTVQYDLGISVSFI